MGCYRRQPVKPHSPLRSEAEGGGVILRISFCLAILASLSIIAWGEAPPKKRVAIFDFDNAAVQGGITSPFFQTKTPDLGKAAAGLLITKLVQDGNVSVIERDAIDKLLAEQNLTNSDRADRLTAAKLGKVLGVDAIILGTITHYDYVDKSRGGGPHFGVFGGSMKMKHDIHAKVLINTRLVSPDTAEVLAASEGTGEIDRKGVKRPIGEMADASDVFGGHANSPILNECMDKAIAQLAAQLEQEFLKLPPRVPVIEGLVADANESGQLVLNVGSHDGVKLGDHLQVWRAGKEIRDPATGKLLIRDDKLLGEAVVTTVNDISSVAHYNGQEPVMIRDLVKSIPKQH